MIVEEVGLAACKSYLIGCERGQQAVLVDPLVECVEPVMQRLDELGLRLSLVVDTHTHADHVSAGAVVAERADVPYALHESCDSTLPTEKLRDGQVLEVGDVRVEVLHTPGHTPCSISLRADRELLTGDFLFLAQDGSGRLDLPGGDPAAHWDSLQRLSSLGDDHVVRPGHDYNGLTDSPLGVERRRNPRFQNVTRQEYDAWHRAIAMPTPRWMLDVIAANLGQTDVHRAHHDLAHHVQPDPMAADMPGGGSAGACCANPMGRVPLLFPPDAHARVTSGTDDAPFLLDVREPWEFHGPTGRHAPGATLIPLGELPSRLAELPADKDRELLVICKSGGRSAHAAEFLIARGWRRVFNVATGTDGWVHAQLPIER